MTFRRVSGLKLIKVDVRLITATNRDLEREVQEGRFREDLFHRLNVLTLRIPPIRERESDIQLLAEHFLRLHARRCGSKMRGLTREALHMLRAYSWPGNVRELSHVMERCVLIHRDKETLDRGDLPQDLIQHAAGGEPQAAGAAPQVRILRREGIEEPEPGVEVELPSRPVSWDTIERAILRAALSNAAGNVSEAARLLDLGRGQLRYRMKRLGVSAGGPKRYRPLRRMKRRRPRQQAA
jgi:transcriptional regulator with GAF, ATPase, and Fis domain